MAQSTAGVSTRTLRENLRETLEQAAKGKEILVTLRGKPYVRIVPVAADDNPSARYPLRGSVVHIADDFDEPMDLADALQKKPSKSGGAARSTSRAPAPVARKKKRK